MNVSPDRRTRVHTSSALRRRGVLSLALMQAIAAIAMAGPASATTPTPNTGAISQSNQGTEPPSGTSTTGGQPADISVTVTGTQIVGDGNNAPAIAISSTGGTGSTGLDGDTSYGGAGGTAGFVTLTMDAGSAVVGSGGENAVISLNSTGGAGNTAGDIQNGMPGQPGAGGNSNGIQFAQSGSVYSSNGWNGSTPGTTAILMQANGGNAAQPLGDAQAQGLKVTGPAGGTGGNGGSIDYHLYEGDVTSAGSAIVALSQGGTGGDGTQAYAADSHGGAGGAGGAGGDIQIYTGQSGSAAPNIKAVGAATAATGITVPINANGDTGEAAVMAAGIQAQSIGGQAGQGGTADGGYTNAGAGGAAGGAGTVTVALGSTNITTTGFAAAGVLAQSIGGAGGNGAGASGIWSHGGGRGGPGGDAQEVQVGLSEFTAVQPTSLIKTDGNDSMAVVAQSIGGGGGAGGAVQTGAAGFGMAIGGDGESGGKGSVVSLYNGYPYRSAQAPEQTGFVVSTKGTHSSALVAQSIGGGGGTGGSAQTTSIGVFSYAVGGSGGGGGSAGTAGTNQVTVYNNGIVDTAGNHAKGVVGQAVGGGGGDGGSAVGQSATNTFNVNVAVGGNGGSGGTAGDVLATNAGQIITSGADAWGLLGQSVGGGGGNGGMSKSEAYDLATNEELPTVQISASVGGTGGDGSAGGNVDAYNTGLIMTSGAAAHGILAQSISGGGGNGGDSSANSTIIGDGESVTIKVDVGGQGGASGAANAVTADNSAGSFIFTAGDSARGIFAQSVGGGGGHGGTGKSDTRFVSQQSNSDNAAQLTLTVGGEGGSGSAGGNVTATNEGNILTLGDNGNGMFAQSVGGGGGVAGSATAKGTGGKHTETITVSGSSGSGANGGTVTANNNGTIITYGGDAAAIYAQSIGGGGGKAGSATTAGSPDTAATIAGWLPNSTALKDQLQTYSGVQALADNAWTSFEPGSLTSIAGDYLAYAAQQTDNLPADSTTGSANVSVSAGGGAGGGAATQGDGGEVDVTNHGTLLTMGPLSSGIFAQSVGGGGGDAGSTQVQKLQSSGPQALSGTVTLGGRTLNGGDGGPVNAHNIDSPISTQGDASFGIFAQSIGGGGGHGTMTASGFASPTGTPTTLTLGGDGFTHGNGGNVTVTNAIDSASDGAFINTGGNDAVGIVAQSIGGGGGDIIVMHTKANANGNGYSVGTTDPTIDGSGSQTNIQVGGTTPQTQDHLCSGIGDGYSFASCGNGGTVSVTATTASFNTQGRQAHGILAQSIGGGGGWITGVSYGGSDPFISTALDGGDNLYMSAGGNGGNVNVNVTGDIVTYGAGAYGILAQSVGGGGILGGDLGDGGTPKAFPLQEEVYTGPATMRWGQGGDIDITVNGYQLLTKGDNSPAIFAQSVGGGGGLMATTSGMLMGTAGGTGYAGSISIDNNGGFIQASGNHSNAIYVNSEGHNDSGSNSDVYVQNSGTIYGVTNAPVIVLSGQHNRNGNGQVINSGTIASVDTGNNQPAPGTAITVADVDTSEKPYIVVTNQASGKIYGDIDAGNNGSTSTTFGANSSINNAGYWAPSTNSTAAFITNNGGTIAFNAAGQDPMSPVTLNTLQFNDTNGTIVMPMDFENQNSPMTLNGTMSLQGTTFVLQPTRLLPNAVGLNAGAFTNGQVTAHDTGNFLFTYNVLDDGEGDVAFQPVSQLTNPGGTYVLDSNLLQIATNLQNNFTPSAGDSLAQTYANLSTINNIGDYMSALVNLGSQSVQAASAAHLSSSQAFVERMNSCPQFDGNDTTLREHDCGWVRVVADNADHDATSNSVGFKQNGQTVQLGGQREVGNDWFVGGSLSYDQNDMDSHAVDGHIDGEGWSAGVVVKHQMGDWLVSGALDGGRMSYDGDRHLLFTGVDRHATSQFDVSHIGLHSRIARQIPFSSWYLKPYVDLHATHLESGAYTEQGADDLSLQVNASSENVFAVAPMLEAGGRFNFGSDKTLRLYGGLGGAFYSEGAVGSDMQFVGGDATQGTFHIETDLPNERVKATAGADLKVNDHLNVRFEYGGEFASHFEDNAESLKVSYQF